MSYVAKITAKDADKLRLRDPDEFGRVTQHRYLSHNSPVIAGTRIRTEAIWNFHRAGYDADAIIEQYPRLTKIDVDAALEFEHRRRHRVAS